MLTQKLPLASQQGKQQALGINIPPREDQLIYLPRRLSESQTGSKNSERSWREIWRRLGFYGYAVRRSDSSRLIKIKPRTLSHQQLNTQVLMFLTYSTFRNPQVKKTKVDVMIDLIHKVFPLSVLSPYH